MQEERKGEEIFSMKSECRYSDSAVPRSVLVEAMGRFQELVYTVKEWSQMKGTEMVRVFATRDVGGKGLPINRSNACISGSV